MPTLFHGNQSLTFDNVIHLDGTNGNDSGDGTLEKPFKSLDVAYSNLKGGNDCIYIISSGTYVASNGIQGLLKADQNVTYLPSLEVIGKVIFDLQKTEYNVNIAMTKENVFIGVIFKLSKQSGLTGGRFYEYFFDSSTINLSFNNCVFDNGLITPSQTILSTGNSIGSIITKLTYTNCSVIPTLGQKGNNYWTRGTFVNCAFTGNYTTEPYNLLNAKFDNIYNITTGSWENVGSGLNQDGKRASIGVYGGSYDWIVNTPIKITIDNPNATVPKNTVYPFSFSINPPKVVEDILVNQAMQNLGQVGTGTMFNQVMDRTKWDSISDIMVQ
jgi:hypothetical protein